MGTITERLDKNGQKAFQVKIRIKGFPVQSASFTRITDARRWEQQTEAAIREHRFFPQDKSQNTVLSELIERYIQTILPRKPKSYKDQKQQLLVWDKHIGNLRVADITPALISEIRDRLLLEVTHRRKPRSPATINRYTAVLRHLFTIAIKEWQICRENPVSALPKLKETRGRTRYLSPDERRKLLEACKESDNKYLYTVVVLAISIGARKSEILTLKWENVDLNRQTITLTETKNNEIRSVPLQGLALDLIRDLAESSNMNPDDYLFKSDKVDKPVIIAKSWNTVVKKINLKDFRFHDLRHTTASYLAMNGASLNEIAEVLGHKTLDMVMRYAHLSEGHTKRVVGDMNNKIFSDDNDEDALF